MTIRFDAAYYDGKSSSRRIARVLIEPGGGVTVRVGDAEQRYRLADLEVSARLADTPRRLGLPDGGSCETTDNDAVDAALAGLRSGARGTRLVHRLVHRLESRLGYALAALLITVLSTWAFVEYGIPFVAERIADELPPSAERALGRHGLDALDRTLLAPSALDAEDRARAERVFARTLRAANLPPPRPRLALRASKRIGANAFALPAGIVVVTDDMVRLAANDDELAAVLAHELGHLYHRHILRQLLQNSATALLIAVTLGDLSSLTGLSATLPTFLVQQKYSRAFELEADQYSLQLLKKMGIAPSRLGDVLHRLAKSHGDDERRGVVDFLASHPATEERIRALRGP